MAIINNIRYMVCCVNNNVHEEYNSYIKHVVEYNTQHKIDYQFGTYVRCKYFKKVIPEEIEDVTDWIDKYVILFDQYGTLTECPGFIATDEHPEVFVNILYNYEYNYPLKTFICYPSKEFFATCINVLSILHVPNCIQSCIIRKNKLDPSGFYLNPVKSGILKYG